jgi:hypothetical protein
MSECYLYVLLHSDETAIKIGVAKDILQRTLSIPHEILFDRSLMAAGSRDACYRAEGVLHRLLQRHRLDRLDGSGGTEWFSADCRDKAELLFETLREELGMGPLGACQVKKREPEKQVRSRNKDHRSRDALRKNLRSIYELERAFKMAKGAMDLSVRDGEIGTIHLPNNSEMETVSRLLLEFGVFRTEEGCFALFVSEGRTDESLSIGLSGEQVPDADTVFMRQIRSKLILLLTEIAPWAVWCSCDWMKTRP